MTAEWVAKNKRNIFFYSSRGWKSTIEVYTGPCSFWAWLSPACSSLHGCLSFVFVSRFPCLRRTPATGLSSSQSIWPCLNLIISAKTLFCNKNRHSFGWIWILGIHYSTCTVLLFSFLFISRPSLYCHFYRGILGSAAGQNHY